VPCHTAVLATCGSVDHAPSSLCQRPSVRVPLGGGRGGLRDREHCMHLFMQPPRQAVHALAHGQGRKEWCRQTANRTRPSMINLPTHRQCRWGRCRRGRGGPGSRLRTWPGMGWRRSGCWRRTRECSPWCIRTARALHTQRRGQQNPCSQDRTGWRLASAQPRMREWAYVIMVPPAHRFYMRRA
jgi:hypothetical protein